MAEDTMEVENTDSKASETAQLPEVAVDEEDILNCLIYNKHVYFKSQQIGEDELSVMEKREIASKIFSLCKSTFLCRFGKHLKEDHLEYFKQFLTDENDGYAVGYYIADLKRFFTKSKREKDIKNRRYDALKRLVKENFYFTETEMMKRNPLLYNQLVGQYMSDEEKKVRDNVDTKNITFVNLLLETIDRDSTRKKQKQQQDDEDHAMEEDIIEKDEEEELNGNKSQAAKKVESDSWDEEEIPDNTVKWGEIPSTSKEDSPPRFLKNLRNIFTDEETKPKEIVMITANERKILKEEFISVMYQSFLDGKDVEFDYTTVDDNEEYDNLQIKSNDAEETYFDSETPEDIPPDDERMASESNASEDELDVFMDRLNKHHTIETLSDDLRDRKSVV